MNLTPEVLLGIITAVTGTMAATISFLGRLILMKLSECEADREVQKKKIEELHVQLFDLSQQCGRMESHLQHIDKRNSKVDAR